MATFEHVRMIEPYIITAKVHGDSTNYFVNLEFMFKRAAWYTPTTHYGLALSDKRHQHFGYVNRYINIDNKLLSWALHINDPRDGRSLSEHLDVSGLKYLYQKQKIYSVNDLIKISPTVVKLMANILRNPKDYQRELNAMHKEGSPILALLQCAPLRPAIFEAVIKASAGAHTNQYTAMRQTFVESTLDY